MLQRIQSVYLALVFLLSIGLFFLPVCLFESTSTTLPETGNLQVTKVLKLLSLKESTGGVTNTISIPYMLIALDIVVGAMAVFAIFLFKNRKQQMLICRLNLVAICLLTAAIFFIEEQLKKGMAGHPTYLIGTYIPVIQLILTYLAERAIKKDDELVKSADRLR